MVIQVAIPAGACAKAPPLAHLAHISQHPPAFDSSRSALVVLLTDGEYGSKGHSQSDTVGRELLSIPRLSVGLFSTAQGTYTSARMLQDIDRAARLANTNASPARLRTRSLPTRSLSRSKLLALVSRPQPGELVLIVELASAAGAHELGWSALAGLGVRGSMLSSQTTEQRGLIAAIDVAPTLLEYLRLPVPASMHGKPIHLAGALDGAALRSLKARLEVVYPRRLPALACLLCAWALLGAAALLVGARSRRKSGNQDTAPVRWAIRVGALATLWAPVAVLAPAALEPGPAAEYALIVGLCFSFGVLNDRLIAWPRALIAPATAAVLAIVLDALLDTQLLMRSLLGPNPAYGSRFYGIGNELKSALAVLVFTAVAAALYPDGRSRRAAATMACVGALLALVEGAARIGAGVGGVVLVCAGTAVATVTLLPGPRRRGGIMAVMAAPLVGLLLLAIVDLGTAHGAGHFTGSVLDARSASDIHYLIVRRYEAAWNELGNGLMPLATTLALLLAATGVRHRKRLLWPVQSDPAWLAALAGGLTAGLVGTLSEDSGPVLLVIAVFAMACVLAYLWGEPRRRQDDPALTPSARAQTQTLTRAHTSS